jgi:hypothetical protein
MTIPFSSFRGTRVSRTPRMTRSYPLFLKPAEMPLIVI